MRTHFIAIMECNAQFSFVAQQKDIVTGSDDAFFEPSKSRLEKKEFYRHFRWHPEKITHKHVISGMHAKADNSELKAQELGLKFTLI
jgi:UDP-N-acetylmuramate: L-alanyl-gamma-D-glutamyl-meso-diaminopimelate ligase